MLTAIDILFPRTCPICFRIVLEKGRKICRECEGKVPYLKEPRCKCCSKEVIADSIEYCCDCFKRKHSYDKGLALVNYNADIKASIYAVKYGNKREYLDFYADSMMDKMNARVQAWQPDIMIPIPLHAARKRNRGFNQSEILAVKLGKRMGIQIDKKVLDRVKKTMPQKELSTQERRQNLKNAFKCRETVVKYKRIILIDDIYTTGTTIDEASRVLKEAGAEAVFYISICIGKGF